MQINTGIFKAYDIRGIYPEQLDEQSAYLIARAYATLLKKRFPEAKKIALGSDMRLSGPSLKERVLAGLLDSGIDVEDIGLVSTPTFYFAVAFYGYDGGLQISASHNPKEWNGIKIVSAGGKAISGEGGIYEMRDLILNDQLVPLAETKGTLTSKSGIAEQEAEEQLNGLHTSMIKPLKIVVDTANAMGSEDMRALFKHIRCEIVELNYNLDGNFPAHEADPMKEENIAQLKGKVVTEGADLGIASDGDGDRYFFVDEKGNSVPQPILRGLIAQALLRENPGSKIGMDVRPGKISKDMIEAAGGTAVLTRVGHALIKDQMLKENMLYAGESSGHHYFRLPYGTFEAPMILVTRLLQFLTEQNRPFSEIVSEHNKYYASGEINLKLDSREACAEKIELVKHKYSDGNQFELDGISVEYPDYWFNLRASNTEPLIRLSLEGVSKDIVQQKAEEIKNLILE